jgi:hypothetical protein
MLAAGDLDSFRSILDFVASLLPLARNRTALQLPAGDAGAFWTETINGVNGLYLGEEYACDPTARPDGYPVWLTGPGSLGGWVRFDFGGNGWGPEAGFYALQYYWATGNASAAAPFIPIATAALDFYASHYRNRSADGTLLMWPTQVQ